MPKNKKQPEILQEQSQIQQQSVISSEDQDAALLTDKVEQTLLETLAKIKLKDPSIYQTKSDLYQQEDFNQTEKSKSKVKSAAKMTYKDLLAQGQEEQQDIQQDLPPVQEQKNAKAKFKKLLEKNIQKIKEDKDDLFQIKEKISTKKSNQKQSLNDQQKFEDLTKNFKKSTKGLIKAVWNSDQLDETDLFLKKYILNKTWLTSKMNKQKNEDQQKIDEEDEERSLEMDQYEAEYNFRFQQPGGTTITQYPRQIQNSLRQKPETRKEKRKKQQQRKREEQASIRKEAENRREQLKHEILERLVPQNEQEDQQHDWFFCDDCCRGLNEGENVWKCYECEDYMLCQECNQLIIHKHQLTQQTIQEGFGAPQNSQAKLTNLKSCLVCRKRITPMKKRYQYTDRSYIVTSMCETCFDQANLSTKKKYKQIQPETVNYEQLLQKNPQKIKELTNQKQIEQMVDQYLKNQFEDVISGGLKTKFRYINVPAQSFGLSDEQILFGQDKQLNKYVSIKRLAPYSEDKIRLRNSIFNNKIKSIKKSVKSTKNLLEKGYAKLAKMRYLSKRKNRALAVRSRMQKRLKVINLSNKQTERNHFVSNTRLQSYGLQTQQNTN